MNCSMTYGPQRATTEYRGWTQAQTEIPKLREQIQRDETTATNGGIWPHK